MHSRTRPQAMNYSGFFLLALIPPVVIFGIPPLAADENPTLFQRVEAEAADLEEDAKPYAREALAEGEQLATKAKSEARQLVDEVKPEVEKLATGAESFIEKEAPAVEAETKTLETEADDLDRRWEPVIAQDVDIDAEKLETESTRESTIARERFSSESLWLMAYLRALQRDGKLEIDDDLLKLNLLSPGLGTRAVDEMRYLKRASQLEIREGASAAEREAARLLQQSRDDLHAAGHWTHEELHDLEDTLSTDEVKIKRAVLADENKADFYLNGRPLSDIQKEAVIAHNNLLVSNEFPSAALCAECHPGQYRQWSVSQHAYAQLSPVYNAMSERINRLTNGTNGDFCVRCHNEAGMAIKEPVFIHNADRLPVTREGISCIVCHRVENAYGRTSGRFGIEKGDLTKPMYGPLGREGLDEVLDNFNVTTDAAAGTINWKKDGAQVIHDGAVKVKTFASAQLCSNCHDVNSQNTFRLEEAYSQFRNSPAAAEGTVCQDCHMGTVLGKVSGYDQGPIAYIGGVPTPVGKRTNHMFAGPDYSIVHPGVFPHNPEAETIASFREWLEFDIEAGWGTKEFEAKDHPSSAFPAAWQERRHRLRAAEFLKDQLRLLGEIRAQSFRTLRYGYQLGKLEVTRNDARGLSFELEVRNATNGHGVPTGFDGEREVFLNVMVRDADGKLVFLSGDRDPNGDVRNIHSEYVRNNKLPVDDQLFSLQSAFLELSAHGGERERILPVPVSQTALPFLRPNESSGLLIAHPTNTRKQAAGIPPLGSHTARYKIPGRLLSGRPPYTVEFTFVAQMVPVNLINEISSVGFDYDLAPRDVANRVVMGAFPLWNEKVVLGAEGSVTDLKPTNEEVMGHEAVTPALPWLNLPQSWQRELTDGQPISADQ